MTTKNKLSNEEILQIYDSNISLLTQYATDINIPLPIGQIKQQIVYGSIKLNDIIELNTIIDINRIHSYLEIGSYVGFSFYMFMKLIQPNIGISIDPNVKHRIFHTPRMIFNKLNQEFLISNRAKCYDGFFAGLTNNSLPDRKIFLASDFSEKFDCIFIDGEHDYLSVQRDFLEAAKLLSEDGVIVLHDIYSWKGVERFCIDIDHHYDWDIIRTNKENSIDGFAVVSRIKK